MRFNTIIMILTVDIGNTRIKSAVFENNTIFHTTSFKHEFFFNEIENILNQFKKIAVLVVASVGKLDKSTFEVFSNRVEIHFIDRQNPFPF